MKVAELVHGASTGDKLWNDLDEKTKKKKSDRTKKAICTNAVELMTESQLNEIDPQKEVISWLKDIGDLLAIL